MTSLDRSDRLRTELECRNNALGTTELSRNRNNSIVLHNSSPLHCVSNCRWMSFYFETIVCGANPEPSHVRTVEPHALWTLLIALANVLDSLSFR